jgi:hypothetical protein
MRPHIIITMQRRETLDAGGQANRREAGMAGGGEGAAVIHGRADRNAGGHLVVEQSPDARLLVPNPGGASAASP